MRIPHERKPCVIAFARVTMKAQLQFNMGLLAIVELCDVTHVQCLFVHCWQECQNPCCNATTCMLADGADCGEGQCCENCQFKAYGTTCREAVRECDVMEYCNGDSPDCPANLQLQDGTSCSNNQSYCFTGVCRSHDQQCRFHWGQGRSTSSWHIVCMQCTLCCSLSDQGQ